MAAHFDICPLAQRWIGRKIRSSLAIRPGAELYIVANDGDGGRGAWVVRTLGFAPARTLFSHP